MMDEHRMQQCPGNASRAPEDHSGQGHRRTWRRERPCHAPVSAGWSAGFILLTLALAFLNMAGCALFSVTTKQFVEQDQHRLLVFSKHEIEPLFRNSLYAEDKNVFSITICQRQPAPPDSVDASTLDYARLEDLSVSFEGEGAPIRLTPTAPGDDDWREILGDGFLHGPIYHWGWLHIPESCAWIEITYTAILVGGDGSGEIERQIVRQKLYRKHGRTSFLAI
jgi:hypothetical protein